MFLEVLYRLAKLFIMVFGIIVGVGFIMLVYEIVQVQRKPSQRVESLHVGEFSLDPNNELQLITTVSVRKGCVGLIARGFVRKDPANPHMMDVQVITNAPLPVGLGVNDITPGTTSISSSSTSDKNEKLTYRQFIPIPPQVVSGPGWHFAEFSSQEGCGWLHGIVPVTTLITIGPEILIQPDQSAIPAHAASAPSGH